MALERGPGRCARPRGLAQRPEHRRGDQPDDDRLRRAIPQRALHSLRGQWARRVRSGLADAAARSAADPNSVAPPAATTAVVMVGRRDVSAIPAAAAIWASMEAGAAASGDQSDLRPRAGQRHDCHSLSRNRRKGEKPQRPRNKNLHACLSSRLPFFRRHADNVCDSRQVIIRRITFRSIAVA